MHAFRRAVGKRLLYCPEDIAPRAGTEKALCRDDRVAAFDEGIWGTGRRVGIHLWEQGGRIDVRWHDDIFVEQHLAAGVPHLGADLNCGRGVMEIDLEAVPRTRPGHGLYARNAVRTWWCRVGRNHLIQDVGLNGGWLNEDEMHIVEKYRGRRGPQRLSPVLGGVPPVVAVGVG